MQHVIGIDIGGTKYAVQYSTGLGRDRMNLQNITDIALKIIRQLKDLKADIREECPIGIVSMENWEWPQGVALFAMYNYYRETGDKKILDYLVHWFDHQIAGGLPCKNVNTMCPMLTLSCLYEETGNPEYLPLLREWAGHFMKKMPRTEENGIQHVVSGGLNEGQLWDDTLYMAVLFAARTGVILGEDSYVQESIFQFLLHIKYLTDTSTGLLFHGWTFSGRHNFAKALWGRGNSWYTAGLVDYMDMVDLPEGIRKYLVSTLETQVGKLAELQDETGLWHTLLDDPGSYLETSCSAAFAYGILKAVRKGYIDIKYLDTGLKALSGVIERIDSNGTVRGVSYGTPVSNTLQEYRDITVCPMPYGQSMVLMMLVEGMKHNTSD
jgi:unsaturated rhamnogalacturonyl hydrolase